MSRPAASTLPTAIPAPHPAAGRSAAEAELRADVGDRLARALARRRGEYVTRIARDGVSAAQMGVLMRLRTLGDMSISGLAEVLGIGLPNVTGLVDRLEERGLVERLRDPGDRRVVRVHLTDPGSRIPDGMEGLQRDVLGRVVDAMDRGTLERCLAVLDAVDAEAGPDPVDPRCAGRAGHRRA
jgi:DNA-binding MarR family transcriptional regulator